jgi:hypothetical protein
MANVTCDPFPALAAARIHCYLSKLAKVACGAFADNAFAAGRKRRDFCGLFYLEKAACGPFQTVASLTAKGF